MSSLLLVTTIEKICRMTGFRFVHLHNAYIDELMNVPKMEDHKDPFDRLLIA